jgi:hypothetical protein
MRHCYSTIITSVSERLSTFRRVHVTARIGYLWAIPTGPIALVPVIERITNKGIITVPRGVGGGTRWGKLGGGGVLGGGG